MRALVRIAEIADVLRRLDVFGKLGERIYIRLALLHFELGIVYGAKIYARGRTRLKAAKLYAESVKRARQSLGTGKADGPRMLNDASHNDVGL